MKDISPRLFVLVLAIALIGAVVYLTAIKAMAEAVTSAFFLAMAATLPGMIAALAGVKTPTASTGAGTSSSDPPASGPMSGVSTLAKLTTPAASVVMTLAALATMVLAGCLLPSCTPSAQQQGSQTAAHVLTFGADICESIAHARGRDDIAALCHATEDGAIVLDKATEPAPAACAVSDAGAD